MASCEMCGKEGNIFTAIIEGTTLNVCSDCASFGKVIKKPVITEKKKQKNDSKPSLKPSREIIQIVRENYSKLIREKREKMGLSQKEFSKFLAEKESLIHKLESGLFVPSLELARKLEKQLGISLIEQKEVSPQGLRAKEQHITIGDVIKLKE